ncbi:MAG TPA: hypothetical protein VF006_28825 [Longimicrobium sp.]
MKMWTMALVAGAALLCASPAQAQDQWMQQVAAQLDAVVEALDAEGLTPAGDPHGGALEEGEAEEVELELTAGSYLIVGVCDADCSDLDLLLSLDGDEIDSDYETDDTPVLAVEVEEGGTLILTVEMATCSNGPCRFGIGVFSTN